MLNLASHFSLILTGLKAVIARTASKDWSRTAFLCFVWNRLNRTTQRFERLYARWQNGTLPNPRAPNSRAPNSRAPRPAKPPAFRLPRGRAWLLCQLQHHEANGRASQLKHLIAMPELQAFLAAAPQAGRLLRPLCRMLGINLEKPYGVPLPPPAASARPEPAPPPTAPAQTAPVEVHPPGHAAPAPSPLFSTA